MLASQEITQDKKFKSGNNTQINLRDRLYDLKLLKVAGEKDVELRYVGSSDFSR